MILVYSDDITPRHSYTWDLVFHEILGMPYEITTDKEEFKAFQGYRIAYSDESLGDCIQIKPHGLLSEKIIRNQDITIKQWEDMPVFFGDSEDMEWPFDPFAMCFYLVSRYEEYLPFKSDLHGRFPATLSMAYEHGFLDRPLVNQIVARLQNKILIKYPALNFPPIKFTFKPTFDVDIAYAHLGKGAMRAMGGFLKLFIKRDVSALSERTRTITGKIKDPYDNFDFNWSLCVRRILFLYILF